MIARSGEPPQVLSPRGERLAHLRRSPRSEDFDRPHQLGMIQDADSHLDQEAVEPEDLMRGQDLVRDLGRASRSL